MEEPKFLSELLTSHKLENSPVSYLQTLLSQFFSNAIDTATFRKEFLTATRRAKVCLGLMSKTDIVANKKFFFKEFCLPDNINKLVLDEPDEQEFRCQLKNHIEQYSYYCRANMLVLDDLNEQELRCQLKNYIEQYNCYCQK